MSFRLWLAMTAMFVLCVPAVAQKPDLGATTRVAVVHQAKALTVSSSSGLKLKSLDGLRILAQNQNFRAAVGEKDGEIKVDDHAYPSGVIVSGGEAVTVDGKRYRGYLRLVRDGAGVTAVNVLPMEQYIRSVLGGEISASWPVETLKAHAVASRSYAVYMLGHPRHEHYDLAATTLDQVYPGTEGEDASIAEAVDAVRGEVLVNGQGEVLKTFYSSNCGGHTADSVTVFTEEEHPPLAGVKDPYCAGARNSIWTIEVPVEEVVAGLAKGDKPITAGSRVKSVIATGYDNSGRMQKLVVLDDKGGSREIDGQNLRKTLGYQRLKGARAELSVDRQEYPTKLIFTGGGWGHGVGLCQWGAYTMGKDHDYRAILQHYYPGGHVEKRSSK
jgi:stage II sporulation protein D